MSRAWECIALTEAALLRVLLPMLALVVLGRMMLAGGGIGLEALPTVLGLLCGRLAPPLRSGGGGAGPPTAG